ncbi:hypothetical protein [Amycolatopsis dendrobii]|uniref:Uncharacterized protein n=1 Tax=Amycolatopsis dendrobii TaxID=2760662 RepID=A0A7W3ZAM3_9PSEU|nr:hypothetical protein [Amycolatopsis dendrobii]MBB1153959.1 hypothetical protein [Amycolatopsis dendrobii]
MSIYADHLEARLREQEERADKMRAGLADVLARHSEKAARNPELAEMTSELRTVLDGAQIVRVVEAEGVGAIAAFTSYAAAREYIDACDHEFAVDDLSVTSLVVDKEGR